MNGKENNCGYCEMIGGYAKYAKDELYENNEDDIYICSSNKKYYIQVDSGYGIISFEIFHCPICGRKLNEK